jgi:hypothetical protein
LTEVRSLTSPHLLPGGLRPPEAYGRLPEASGGLLRGREDGRSGW